MMKRILMVLVLVLGLNVAQAGNYFGVSLDASFSFLQGLGPSIPSLGVQFGADFDGGLGVRAAVSSLLIFNHIQADAYYRFDLGNAHSSVYVGAGVGYAILSFDYSSQWFEGHGLLGYEATAWSNTRWFVELQPFASIPSGSYLPFGVELHGGLNFRL